MMRNSGHVYIYIWQLEWYRGTIIASPLKIIRGGAFLFIKSLIIDFLNKLEWVISWKNYGQ